jgi:tRNA threonylcarbamoyl adenosine modification protein (Sua5/YciO/YrdC/YwlC family)
MGFLRLNIEPHGTPSAHKIGRAVEALHRGGVAAYPTDTVYALGCAIDARKATERIYRAKRMSGDQRLAIICPDLSAASEYARFSNVAFRLARRIFPGPYTLIVPATSGVPRTLVDKKRKTVGIRVPAHPVTQALVQALGRPLLTTSAIPPGEDAEPCTYAEDVIDAFENDLDVMVDSGPTAGEPSTILEVVDDEIVVVRQGAGEVEDLLE